jgi:hypothetical protein
MLIFKLDLLYGNKLSIHNRSQFLNCNELWILVSSLQIILNPCIDNSLDTLETLEKSKDTQLPQVNSTSNSDVFVCPKRGQLF